LVLSVKIVVSNIQRGKNDFHINTWDCLDVGDAMDQYHPILPLVVPALVGDGMFVVVFPLGVAYEDGYWW